MKDLLRAVFPSIPLSLAVLLVGLWLNAEPGLGVLVLSLIMALVIPHVAQRLDREFARIGSLKPLPKLIFVMLYDIVRANLQVARLILRPGQDFVSGWVWIPLELTNIHGITALASLITVTPGTISAELSEDRRHILIHVLNLRDPQAIINEIKERYEKPLREIFP